MAMHKRADARAFRPAAHCGRWCAQTWESCDDAVAHATHAVSRRLCVRLHELDAVVHHLRCRLTDNDEAHDDSSVGCAYPQGSRLSRLCSDPPRRHTHPLLHVVEIARKVVFAHTGCAFASTLARNFDGRSTGVSRSTWMPSSDSNSTCKLPKSNNVAPGSASTSRSRPLPSRSVPCSTEPKTRGFITQKRLIASRMALRLRSSWRERLHNKKHTMQRPRAIRACASA